MIVLLCVRIFIVCVCKQVDPNLITSQAPLIGIFLIQCSGDMCLSAQTPKLSFFSSQLCVYRLLFLAYILMPSVWNVITPDRSFSCRSCPGLVRCSDYQPPQTILNSLSHFSSDGLLAVETLGCAALCLSDRFKLSPWPLWLGMTLRFHAIFVSG